MAVEKGLKESEKVEVKTPEKAPTSDDEEIDKSDLKPKKAPPKRPQRRGRKRGRKAKLTPEEETRKILEKVEKFRQELERNEERNSAAETSEAEIVEDEDEFREFELKIQFECQVYRIGVESREKIANVIEKFSAKIGGNGKSFCFERCGNILSLTSTLAEIGLNSDSIVNCYTIENFNRHDEDKSDLKSGEKDSKSDFEVKLQCEKKKVSAKKFRVSANDKIGDLKKRFLQEIRHRGSAKKIRLEFDGEIVKDATKISELDVESGDVFDVRL